MKFALSTEPRASQQYGTIAAPRRAFLIVAWLMAMCGVAFAQGTPRQGGAWSGGRVPMYVGSGSGTNPTVQDSGPASGGGVGVGVSEFGMTARGTGTPPYVGQGTGPYGTNFCDYDAPITNATGYHYLCMTPNSDNGKGLIAFGAGGIATPTALQFIINGSTYDFPISVGGITGPGSSTVGHAVTWNNTAGSLVADAGFAPMNAADNLSTLANMVTSRKNLGLGCPVGNGPNTTTAGSVIGVFASCFGVLADGVTNDTTAWNAAITYANANINTTIIATLGTSVITKLNPITAVNTKIMCASGPGTCIISHSQSPAIELNGGKGFAFVDMGINNTGAACNISFFVRNGSFSNTFDNTYLGTGIGTLATFGVDAAGDIGGSSIFNGLRSISGLSETAACPLFDAVNGNGLIIRGALLFLNAPGVIGRNLVNANINGPIAALRGSWDTIVIQHSFFQFFYDGLHSQMTNAGGLLDTAFENNYFGNCINNCFNVNGLGAFTESSIQNNWMDGQGTGQSCVSIAPITLVGTIIAGNRILLCGTSGIILGAGAGARASDIMISNNRIDSINWLNTGTTYGIAVLGDSLNSLMPNISITNNQIAQTNASFGGNTPSYGILVASGTVGGTAAGFILTSNRATGTILNYAWPPVATGYVAGNIGLPSATSAIAVGGSPFTYTAGPQPETLYMYNGTIAAVTQNGVQVCGVGGCTVDLAPGEAATIFYTVLPTASKTVH